MTTTIIISIIVIFLILLKTDPFIDKLPDGSTILWFTALDSNLRNFIILKHGKK